MKKFFVNFFVGILCSATSFAASDVAISRTIPTKNANLNTVQSNENSELNRNTRDERNEARATISRSVSRTTQNNAKKQNANVVSRSVNTKRVGQRATLSDGVNTVGRSARTEAASLNSSAALRRAGVTLRASTAEVGGRATLAGTNIQTGSNIDEQVRGIQSRASIFGSNKQKTVTAESLAEAKDVMEKTADLNNTCQIQYNECMDQFCAVVDSNQKRCSCSSNLAKYTKAQEAVEEANTELNDVAQRIRYVGLSADEIRAIMSATEAELEMSKTKDKTATRSMLDDIADMIKDPTASTTLNASNDSLLDMDFDFSGDSSDMFSLDIFSSSSNDISSKRGAALYKEATKRCKTVLNRCKDAGGTESQITGNYDLAIAKDCIAYEQGLEKLNDTLKNNVRSANLMLQKARLAVLQNKNEYDIKGCVSALETCMLDDMVCGDNYIKCLDPTKKFIDENGNVVLGQDISWIISFLQDPNGDVSKSYDNTKINTDFIKDAVNNAGGGCTSASGYSSDGSCIVNYLMSKIGTGATVKEGGLCRAVLDKCQDYTYIQNGKTATYQPYNEVVVSYIQRAMVNIKGAQAKIISDYASTCMQEVASCYNQQNTQISSWATSASMDNIYKVMTGACYNVALTCAHAVYAYDTEMSNLISGKSLSEQKDILIKNVSQLFYQSLLCPDNSIFVTDNTENIGAYVNDRCACKDGYYVSGSSCVSACPSGYTNINGVCSIYVAPTATCPTEKYVKAVSVDGVWSPRDCSCASDTIFVMGSTYAPANIYGACRPSSSALSNAQNWCSYVEDISYSYSTNFNAKTGACDCKEGYAVWNEHCRKIDYLAEQFTKCFTEDTNGCFKISYGNYQWPAQQNTSCSQCGLDTRFGKPENCSLVSGVVVCK